ncbi:MAG: class I SAM-dependent methyltransferase [Pseudomonadota bacterium]
MSEADDGLTDALGRLGRIFDLDRVAQSGAGLGDIERYYRTNRLAYTLLHSRANILHLGLSSDGAFKADDLYEQSREVAALFGDTPVDCLELAAGRGANSEWLARARPDSRFKALDLSEAQLAFARRAAGPLDNLAILQGDYHDLSGVAGQSLDFVFVIEALCYSPDKAAVFREVARVLRPGGRFLVYDGYREPGTADRSTAEDRAARLLERGMAVGAFETFDAVHAAARSAGFRLRSDRDLSEAVLPTCDRLARRAAKFLRLDPLARLAVGLLPHAFTNNIVAGLLFPILMRRGTFSYRASLFQTPQAAEPPRPR